MPSGRSRREQRTPRPTMADVGRLAGVSPTAVSFVINGRVGEISEETRDRVLDAVRELGYRPNRAARGLRTRRSHTIGLVAGGLGDLPCGGQTLAGAHDAAAEHGSRLILALTGGPHDLRTAVEDLLDRQVDALLMAAIGRGDDLPGGHVPVILVNQPHPSGGVPCVLPAERDGAEAATRLLLDAGHRRIAFLAGDLAAWPTRERHAGYAAALAARGAPYDGRLVLSGVLRVESGIARTRAALALRPTALLCDGERLAVGAYLALAEAGVRVPDDMSVLGWDSGRGIAAELRPGLSTVQVPFRELGRRAVQRLLGGVADAGHTYLPCPVVPRGSVAAPPTP